MGKNGILRVEISHTLGNPDISTTIEDTKNTEKKLSDRASFKEKLLWS